MQKSCIVCFAKGVITIVQLVQQLGETNTLKASKLYQCLHWTFNGHQENPIEALCLMSQPGLANTTWSACVSEWWGPAGYKSFWFKRVSAVLPLQAGFGSCFLDASFCRSLISCSLNKIISSSCNLRDGLWSSDLRLGPWVRCYMICYYMDVSKNRGTPKSSIKK